MYKVIPTISRRLRGNGFLNREILTKTMTVRIHTVINQDMMYRGMNSRNIYTNTICKDYLLCSHYLVDQRLFSTPAYDLSKIRNVAIIAHVG